MSSEAPSNTRIFFKDKKNELKGPFNECQIQEMYRDGQFGKSFFKFYFMQENESPSGFTQFFTLGKLYALNGIEHPFKFAKVKQSNKKVEEIERKLSGLWHSQQNSSEVVSAETEPAAVAEDKFEKQEEEQEVEEFSTSQQNSSEAVSVEVESTAVAEDEHEKQEDQKSNIDATEIERKLSELSTSEQNSSEVVSEAAEFTAEAEDKHEEQEEEEKAVDELSTSEQNSSEAVSAEVESTAVVEDKQEKQEEEEKEAAAGEEQKSSFEPTPDQRQWITCVKDFYFANLECFKKAWDPPCVESMFVMTDIDSESTLNCGRSPEVRKLLFDELVRAIGEKPYFFCSFCDRFMFTARQTFLHIACIDHTTKKDQGDCSYAYYRAIANMNKLAGGSRLIQMMRQETNQVKVQKEKWSSMSLENPELRPVAGQFGSLDKLPMKDADKAMYTRLNAGPNYKLAQWLVPLLQSEWGKELMLSVDSHIGNAKTRCLDCKLIFANAAEYYDHLLTFSHLRKADTFDVVTLIVNVQKRGTELPWPKIVD